MVRAEWILSMKRADFDGIAKKYDISKIAAKIIRNRDIIDDNEITAYLSQDVKALHEPDSMKNIIKAADIIIQKIDNKSRICIIGDYDVDGITSTYILVRALRRLGADVRADIPHRIQDGYGINKRLIESAYQNGCDTIITCDNGISAVNEIKYAKELNMTVVITDHHEIPDTLPEADAVVDPKQKDCQYPFKDLCGAGVAYKLIQVLYRKRGISDDELHELLEYVALATVSDIVSLKNENRIIVKYGLNLLNNTQNIGLKCLKKAAALNVKMTSYHIGFVIGPCLNASGRLDTALKGLELLLEEDEGKAFVMATQLYELNNSRKQMSEEAFNKAVLKMENPKDNVIVVYLEDCHESIAGIVAGRLKEKFYKPAIVLTDAHNGELKGSARSIDGYNLFEELKSCSSLLLKFGGHELAAGLSLDKDKLDEFRSNINHNCQLTTKQLTKKIYIDMVLPFRAITDDMINELDILEPFGKDNEKPVFANKDIKIISLNINTGKSRQWIKMKLQDSDNTYIDAVFFGNVEDFTKIIVDEYGMDEFAKACARIPNDIRLKMLYYPQISEYNGKVYIQIIVDSIDI